MSTEVLKFVVVLGGIAIVAAIWLMFIYRPRRTGEGDPEDVEPDREPRSGDDER